MAFQLALQLADAQLPAPSQMDIGSRLVELQDRARHCLYVASAP